MARQNGDEDLSRVVARIVIETDEWEDSLPAAQEYPSVQLRRVEIVHARTFSSHELSLSAVFLDEQYFV